MFQEGASVGEEWAKSWSMDGSVARAEGVRKGEERNE